MLCKYGFWIGLWMLLLSLIVMGLTIAACLIFPVPEDKNIDGWVMGMILFGIFGGAALFATSASIFCHQKGDGCLGLPL